MRRKHFEKVIEVQERHIQRLEKMVEQLFNALQSAKQAGALLDLAPEVDKVEGKDLDVIIPPGGFFNQS